METDKKEIAGGSIKTIINELGVANIEFFHPQSNSLPSALLTSLASEIEIVGKNDAVKVVVLRSEGERAFCAGASFDELVSIKDLESGTRFFSGFAKVINAMRKCPKFIIGRIHGKTVGGGVGLASAADYCIASSWADIKLSELAVGIGPFVVGPAVERKMGISAFTELSVDASSWRSSDWARDKGLYSEVYASVEAMDQAIENLCERLATYSPMAMKELKSVFWKGTENWDQLLNERAAISGNLVLSDFTKNAINKFKASRIQQ